MFFALVVLVSLSTLVAVGVALRLKRLTAKSCSSLIQGMHYVDMSEVCGVARMPTNDKEGHQLSSEELFERLGGRNGLRRLHHNADAMIQIARYLTLMKPDADDLAALIRRDALKVKWMVTLVSWQHSVRGFRLPLPSSVRDLARTYVRVFGNTCSMYLCLADEVIPLLHEGNRVQVRMMSAGTFPLA